MKKLYNSPEMSLVTVNVQDVMTISQFGDITKEWGDYLS